MAKKDYNDSIFQFEKKATNYKGLIIVVVIALAIFGLGGWYVYTHRDKFDWNIKMPWSKKDKEKEEDVHSTSKPGSISASGLAVPTSLYNAEFKSNGGRAVISEVSADDKGYLFKVEMFSNMGGNVDFTIEKVLIDGYDTSAKLELSCSSTKEPCTSSFRIQKTELDALNIHGFNSLRVFYRFDSDKQGTLTNKSIQVYNALDYDNKKYNLIEFHTRENNFTMYYEKTRSDQSNHYIYFTILNRSYKNKQIIQVKKLIINGELYSYPDLEEHIYMGTNKSFYLSIPKDKFKKLESFTAQFFVTTTNYKGDILGIYVTSEYTREV